MLKKKVRSATEALRKLYKPPLSVLDIGCREGYSTKYLAKAGYEVTSIEIDS